MPQALVTGCNRGIGLEIVRRLRERGDTVYAVCRRSSNALEATGAEIVAGVDVADTGAVAGLAERIGASSLDLLINNAGMLGEEEPGRPGWEDSIRRQFEVNSLGPLCVSWALMPLLVAGSKIAIITSRVGSLTDNGSGGHYGYRMSKAAVNMAGVNLAIDLKDRQIGVFLVHPGYVRTDMTAAFGGGREPAASARQIVDLLDRLTLEQTGSFWHAEGYSLPW